MFLSPGSPATCCRSLRPCEGIKNYFSSTFSWRSEEDKRIKSNVWLNHHFSESAAWPFIPLLQLWITVQPPVDDDTDQYTAKTHVDQRTKRVNLTAVPHFLRHHTSTSNNLSHRKAIGSADSSLVWPPERRLHLAKLPPPRSISLQKDGRRSRWWKFSWYSSTSSFRLSRYHPIKSSFQPPIDEEEIGVKVTSLWMRPV